MSLEEYQRIKVLPEGGQSTPYLAFHKLTKLQVVIKPLRDLYADFSAKREEEIHNQLGHPHIVRLIDSFQDRGTRHLVLEWCEKGDLFDIQEKFTPEERKEYTPRIVGQIAKGLQHLHQRKIVHRDLKLENIFVSSNGLAKIGDFGMAEYEDSIVVKKKCPGTPIYLAPELITYQPYNRAIDIWALGVITICLLTGSQPWPNSGCVFEHIHANKPFIPQNHPDVLSFIQGTMQTDPSKRFTIEEVLGHSFIKPHL